MLWVRPRSDDWVRVQWAVFNIYIRLKHFGEPSLGSMRAFRGPVVGLRKRNRSLGCRLGYVFLATPKLPIIFMLHTDRTTFQGCTV